MIALADNPQETTLRAQVEASFHQATTYQRQLRQRRRRYSLARTALSGATGLLAGIPALVGAAPGGHWRIVCAIVALAAFAATLVGALQETSDDNDTLSQAAEYVGKLRDLRADLVATPDAPDLGVRYRQILATYDELVQ